MLFATIDYALGFFVGQFHEILFMLFHFLDGLLRLMDHFINLHKNKFTGT